MAAKIGKRVGTTKTQPFVGITALVVIQIMTAGLYLIVYVLPISM